MLKCGPSHHIPTAAPSPAINDKSIASNGADCMATAQAHPAHLLSPRIPRSPLLGTSGCSDLSYTVLLVTPYTRAPCASSPTPCLNRCPWTHCPITLTTSFLRSSHSSAHLCQLPAACCPLPLHCRLWWHWPQVILVGGRGDPSTLCTIGPWSTWGCQGQGRGRLKFMAGVTYPEGKAQSGQVAVSSWGRGGDRGQEPGQAAAEGSEQGHL